MNANPQTHQTETDYASVVAPQTVRLQRLLPGPVERIWDYLTDSDLRRQWLAAGDMQAAEDSAFTLVWRNSELTDPPGHKPEGFGDEHRMDSTITVFEPPHRLAFTWGGGDVTFTLEPRGEQVLLTVTHRGISDRNNLLMIGAGWHQHLDTLVARASGLAPEPFWDGWTRLRAEYEHRIPA
ncbi:SRPBCC family protein [Thermomonas carbonis]|uniref:SRPBCC family protein n=1 Tax=Thermomonas carbonis TaxID=1463158 RepID=A0A7G9ST50_9GAMM|nr:SRPBCC family protein [Thermomonas carbonis]QNN71025.1 SRPBCC family protein [Thermomonas carbonis]GHC04021.1 ATPase [Thermomonas carbonis]